MDTRRRHLPTIGELIAFDSATRHGSFTRAAAELSLAQSAVSRQIRSLEERLGVALFDRVRRRVLVTPAGRRFHAEVREALAQVSDASQRAMAFTAGAQVINLAVLPTFATRWLLPRIPRFLESHPDILIHFSARIAPFDFAAEPFDAAIMVSTGSWAGAQTHHLFDERMPPLASPGYRAAHGIEKPEDLARATLLHQATRPSAWADWFAEGGLEIPNAFRGPHFEQFGMVTAAAAAGLGVALAPSFLVEDEVESGRLIVLFDRSLVTSSAYYLAIPEGGGGSPALRQFTDWLVAEAHSGARA
jgi:LysR family glycine cleavage system transcriptional activator